MTYQVSKGLKKTAAMVVLQCDDAFLLLKRSKEPNKNMYVPVGGKLDPYEEPRATAIRETYEETGIKVDELQFCGVLVETSPFKYNWQSYIYKSTIKHVPPPFCDEGTLEWVNQSDLLKVPTPPTDWQIYQYLLFNKPFVFNAIYDDQMNLVKMIEEIDGIEVEI